MNLSSLIQYLSDSTGLSRDWTGLLLGLLIGFIAGKVLRGRAEVNAAAQTVSMHLQSGAPAANFAGSRISVQTMKIDLDPADTEAVLAHIRSGNKIEAIKLVREKTGLGLAEAKQLVETLAR